MAKLPLALENIGELNEGAFGAEVNLELKRAVEHCFTNPSLEGVRKVKIEIEVQPKMDNLGGTRIEITPSVVLSRPKAKGRTEHLAASYRNGKVDASIITDQQGTPYDSEGSN
jgi:hypothetical protein